MSKIQKKIFFSVTFLIGMFLNIGLYYNFSSLPFSNEMSAEKYEPANNLNLDCDLLEEEQLDFIVGGSSLINVKIPFKIFKNTDILPNLSFPVWQPPKI